MSTETKTVRIELDYHGSDEVVVARETKLTRDEMRAFMVWLSGRTISSFPSDNSAVAASRIHQMLKAAEQRITELEDEIQPLQNP